MIVPQQKGRTFRHPFQPFIRKVNKNLYLFINALGNRAYTNLKCQKKDNYNFLSGFSFISLIEKFKLHIFYSLGTFYADNALSKAK